MSIPTIAREADDHHENGGFCSESDTDSWWFDYGRRNRIPNMKVIAKYPYFTETDSEAQIEVAVVIDDFSSTRGSGLGYGEIVYSARLRTAEEDL